MRRWAFAHRARTPSGGAALAAQATRNAVSVALARHSLSIVLPAYNEEGVIQATVADVAQTLAAWGAEYEVIVVNDGSADRTGELVATLAAHNPHIHLITHATNQGYGAALISGFAAAGMDLTLLMDSDGQFAISDLARLLVHIDDVDAVLGYRLHRRDAWPRLVNAWGWQILVRRMLGVGVRDLDCAFKLLRTDFLRRYPPTTRSALINAELLYTLHRVGATYREVGVRHLPRAGGRATGANPRVITRALWDLLTHARQWRRRGYEGGTASPPSPLHCAPLVAPHNSEGAPDEVRQGISTEAHGKL
jgi:glycosyltransferase involved in cell wall biosynthesis